MTTYKEKNGMLPLALTLPLAAVGVVLLVPSVRRKASRMLRRARRLPGELMERARHVEAAGMVSAAGLAALRSAALAGARSALRQIREQGRRD